MLVVPVVLAAALPASFATDYVANWLTFTLNRSRYEAEARNADKAGERYWFWDWGGNVMIGFNRTVVWDARDDATFPTAQQMEPWGVDFPFPSYRVVQKLGPHFYLLED
jgi:predicted Rdx family selenoprotein